MQSADLKPGEHRCPGPSTRDIIMADEQGVAWQILEQRNAYSGSEDIGYDRYISQRTFDLEMKHMWPRVWQWVARSEQLREAGDYVTYDIGPWSILVTRSAKGLKAFHNACLHRGTQLKPSDDAGYSPKLSCPYHGWTWSIEGALEGLPCAWDFPHVDREGFRLPEVRLQEWGGFVFINIDGKAPPLDAYLGALDTHLVGDWDLSRRAVEFHIRKVLPTNWKAAQEAFLEAYHVMATHSQNLPYAGDANAQYDIFDDNVSRFVHTHGKPSPHIKRSMSEQDIADLMHLPTGTRVPEGSTARRLAADLRRTRVGEKWGTDLSRRSDSDMLDSIEYHLFPNMCLFPGVSLPMVYRFRPLGMDPSRTIFDLLFLRPLAEGEDHPEPVDPITVLEGESYGVVPGLEPWLAATFDQDTDNLARQYRGFSASAKRGQTLGNYQESRIRHFHQVLDRYLSATA